LRDAAARPEPDTEVKTYYMVPNRRVQGFVGREDVLSRVKAGFQSGPGPRIVVIRAMGGQGKTQVALEYCRRSKNALFKGIFWVDATSENTLKKSFETIAESIKVPGKILREGGRVEFVIEELEQWADPWLIVFDNYDDPGLFNVGEYFPRGESGCILVTTRHVEAESLAEPGNAIELLGLNQEPALELLYNQSQIKQTDNNMDDGKAIVSRLGYHPLAITQAGSYIKLRKIQLHEFMAYYKLKRKDVLKQTHQMTQYRRKLNDTEKETALSVFTTWELSFQLIQDKDEAGKPKSDLMTLFSFFNGKDISEQLFKSFCANPKMPRIDSIDPGHGLALMLDSKGRWERDKFVSILIDLTQNSLLQTWNQASDGFCHFSIHPLVRDWVILRNDLKVFWKYYVLASVILGHLVEISYSLDDFKLSFAEKESLLSHIDTRHEDVDLAQADCGTSPCYNFGDLQESEFWFATLFYSSGRKLEAAATISKVVAWRERVLGLEHELTLDALTVYQSPHQIGEVDIDRRIINISEKVLGRDHEKTFRAYTSLVLSLAHMKQFEEAEEIVEKRLKPLDVLFGPQHPMTIRSLVFQACLLMQQGKFSGAEALCRRGLDVGKPVLGLDHILILNMASFLELCILAQGKANEADPMVLCDLLTRRRNLYGANHEQTRFTMEQYATTLLNRKKYSESEAIWREMIDQMENFGAEDKDDLMNARLGLETTLHKLERHSEAFDVWRKAAESYMQSPELQSPESRADAMDYAVFFYKLGEYRKAEAVFRNVLQAAETQYGPDHPEVLATLNYLAKLLVSQSKHIEAEEIMRRVIKAYDRDFGPTHHTTIYCYSRLGKVLWAQKKFLEAEEWFRRCSSSNVQLYGEHHKFTLQSLRYLASVLESQSKYEEAEDLRRRIVNVNKQTLGPTDPETLTCYYNLARVLEYEGKDEEAEQWFKQCYSGEVRRYGEGHEKTFDSADCLASALESRSKYEEAGDIRRLIVKAKEQNLGPGIGPNLDLLRCYYRLGFVLENAGKYREAEGWYWKSYRGKVKFFGEEHRITLDTANGLAGVLECQSKYMAAEGIRSSIVMGMEQVRGFTHSATLLSYYRLAVVLENEEKYRGAEKYYRQCYHGELKRHGEGHKKPCTALYNIGVVLLRQKKYREAYDTLRRVIKTRQNIYGPDHQRTVEAQETLARSLLEQGEFVEATELFRLALEVKEKMPGPENEETLVTLHSLAVSLRENRQYNEAETVARTSIQRHEKVFGLVNCMTMEAVKGLAYTLEYQERFDEAIISYERVLSVYRELLPPNHEKITEVIQDYDEMLHKMKAKGFDGGEKKEGDGIEQVANETGQELDLHHRLSL
jgi:tetratricopeptide (TPR) repeat protein